MATSQALHDRFDRNVVFALTLAGPEGVAAAVAEAVEQAGGRLSDLHTVGTEGDRVVRELVVFAADDVQMDRIRAAVGALGGVEVADARDLAMDSHLGGACEMRSRCSIESNTDLRIIYTPGVARVCKAIQADPAVARTHTNLANKVAIATNGTAVLGLGDIGPLAGLPVMEGKAAIFREFAGISAEPILIDTHDPAEFIDVMEKLACGFGAIQIEDVKAPECFPITRELDRRLSIPVLHDDQHGTATIVLAGLYSALKKTGRKMGDLRCAISGAGAAGTAITELLQQAGIGDVVICDSRGILHAGRAENMNDEKRALAERTNADGLTGGLAEAMRGRDLFIGVSQPNLVSREMVRSMAPEPIVFALANPVSEITVAEAQEAGAAVAADGRIMNNALAYPGLFRGALDCAAEAFTPAMLMAAAEALAERVPRGELMPEMMEPENHEAVAEAVQSAARA